MKAFHFLLLLLLAAGLVITGNAVAEDDNAYVLLAQATDDTVDAEGLKMAALEGLMSAPPERALPLIRKVLTGNHSQAVKSRALFVLSQTHVPEAQALLIDMAADTAEPLRHEAIRMIGIGGSKDSLVRLAAIYGNADAKTRESVLSAFLIAGEPGPLLDIARNARDDDEFTTAVKTLGAMGATNELRMLLEDRGKTTGLIEAYANAGDLESLQRLAAQTDDSEQRIRAIRSMGIVGGDKAGAALVETYRGAADDETRQAALQGLLISGHDDGVLALFRASQDNAEKRKLLRTLVNMNSDLALDMIDATLEGDQQ